MKVLGSILAGGASSRFGSEKSEARLGGITLLDHVIARASPQVDALVLNSNLLVAAGLEIIRDAVHQQGPLSGIIASLQWSAFHGFEYLVTFACDVPFVPTDLVERLREGLRPDLDCVMARRGNDRHYVFGLWRNNCSNILERAFQAGLRKPRGVAGVLRLGYVDFPLCADGPGGDAFFNINSREDLQVAETWLAQTKHLN